MCLFVINENELYNKLDDRLKPFLNKSIKEIKNTLGIEIDKNKNSLVTLSKIMIGLNSNNININDNGQRKRIILKL